MVRTERIALDAQIEVMVLVGMEFSLGCRRRRVDCRLVMLIEDRLGRLLNELLSATCMGGRSGPGAIMVSIDGDDRRWSSESLLQADVERHTRVDDLR